MTQLITRILVLSGIILLAGCYTDDSSQPNPDRLPFEDFTEFFESNNAKADTLIFNSDGNASLTTSNGIQINIPENAFSIGGEISLEVKEATSKSDFIFLDKPTLSGSNLMESSGAISIQPFTSGGDSNIENPINIEIMLPLGTTADNMIFYHFQNGWTADNAIDIQANNDNISFETKRAAWQMGGKNYEDSGFAQLTVNPVGYGTIPHDMRAFVVLSDHNVVLPLEHNISSISASGSVPKGTEINIVVIVMDHFKLSIGTRTMTIDENTDTEVEMTITEVEEMITIIKSLD